MLSYPASWLGVLDRVAGVVLGAFTNCRPGDRGTAR